VSREPTLEQNAAIEARSREVMVEAGAGTGKTGVMVDRYCRLVLDEGVPADAILAFTFTDKAAAELRERVRARIPDLNGDWITTIHGFCNRLLSSHPVAVGIDPRFRVLDAPETARVAIDAFDEAVEAYIGAGGEREREETLAAFDVGGLRGMVIAAHAELRSRGEAEPALPEPPEPDASVALAAARKAAAECLPELKPGSENQELVSRALEVLEGAREPDLDEIAALRTNRSAKPLSGYREAIETAVSRVAEAGAGGRAYRHVAELLTAFSERFAVAKQRRAGVDFEDLQILAVRLLERTEVGASYRSRFRHLLVDEFQDTNRLQLRLIEALHGPDGQLLVVGDELQSIYGFRHADLDVFRERRDRIRAEGDGEVLPLTGNFRSRPEVIGAVNAMGAKLLDKEFRPLRVGAPPAGGASAGDAAVEILLTTKEGWDEEGLDLDAATDGGTPANQLAEARFLAERMRELAEGGVERGSMVVLLRSFTRLDAYEDSLERAGLRPYVVGGRGYWSQQQVADTCALLATIANPLDDQALFGSLASPAGGVSPDTLWLLRAAAGRGRQVWPAVEALLGQEATEGIDSARLAQIPPEDRALLARFAENLAGLRTDLRSLPLASLIDAAVTRTGYDLAILMRPNGEARFANVRKLMRLADDYERAEGRDLRGFLDFLAARADADADAQAATAVEGHDGVRIMTVHGAKGLEFDVVAVPHLSRGLLPPARAPLMTLGHEAGSPRVGMELRRLGARGVKLYEQKQLCEELERRAASEELRLFHVAATRARERLLISGVIAPTAPTSRNGTSVIERLAIGLEIDREADSSIEVPAPEPRPGLELELGTSVIPVRLNRPSTERAAQLRAVHRGNASGREIGTGPAPLVAARAATGPARHLSYTAISAALGAGSEVSSAAAAAAEEGEPAGAIRGRAVHAMLEWSQAHDWARPAPEVARAILDSGETGAEGAEMQPEGPLRLLDAWLASDLLSTAVRGHRTRAEVPLLVEVAGTVLKGSIDLLVERDGESPLVVDYKTDRVGPDSAIADLASAYETQKSIYALAVAEAFGATEVELAYVFLERPDEPQLERWGETELAAARDAIEARIAAVASA
jgi:ATP-dependent exoDNAse (exonuclease V) beta subunit